MKNISIICTTYVADNWYGKRYRYFLEGYSTKVEANKEKGMLKKYLKATNRHWDGIYSSGDINDIVTYPTYIHSVGPCYSCTNIAIKREEFEQFKVKELAAMAERKKEREFFAKVRSQRRYKSSC